MEKITGYITTENTGYKGKMYFSIKNAQDFKKWFLSIKHNLRKGDKVDIHCDNPEIKQLFNQLQGVKK